MTDQAIDAGAIQEWSQDYISGLLKVPREQINPTAEFDSLGLDSSLAVAFIMSMEEWVEIELTPEMLFEHSNVASLSRHVAELLREAEAELASA